MNTMNKKKYAYIDSIDFKSLYHIAQGYVERQGKPCNVQDINTIKELYMWEVGVPTPPRGEVWGRAVSWLIRKDIVQFGWRSQLSNKKEMKPKRENSAFLEQGSVRIPIKKGWKDQFKKEILNYREKVGERIDSFIETDR